MSGSNGNGSYSAFLDRKTQLGGDWGFEPTWIPDFLFDFQKSLVEWAVRKGRGAIFADCGLGKTAMQLVWAENVVRKTNRPILILTPLAVGQQTLNEAEKFGIEASVSRLGTTQGQAKIVITNYERLHYFNRHDFVGTVCDESSILKNFDGKRRAEITEFMREHPYRLLCTATAAPNDYVELGTSSEALGELGYMDMLSKFFKSNSGSNSPWRTHAWGKARDDAKWRFRGHAERDFWRWVCSWARACRQPSDMGFEDSRFVLPELVVRQHVAEARTLPAGFLFDPGARGLNEQRKETRRTLDERCELAADVVSREPGPSVCWCHLNDEGDLLAKLIPGAVQVSGADKDDVKEERLVGFSRGDFTKLVIKPKIGAWGLNWQHCGHQTYFPSHSFEQYYQGTRRSLRFGRVGDVVVDIVTTEGGGDVLDNLRRKADACDVMFSKLVELMNQSLKISRSAYGAVPVEIPSWL